MKRPMSRWKLPEATALGAASALVLWALQHWKWVIQFVVDLTR
ncbi:MAG: hypothetical protein U0V64_15325 [Cyclobacteriaceae bacterium]